MKSYKIIPRLAALGFVLILPPRATAQDYTVKPVNGGGSVTGTVTYGGEPVERSQVTVAIDQEVCDQTPKYSEALIVDPAHHGIQNVVVSIRGIPAGKDWSFPDTGPALDQQGCRFIPHVLVVPAGQTFRVLNNDGLMHNIHTHSKINRSVNRAQPKILKQLQLKINQAEFVRVTCDVHKWMEAWIVAAEHPYFVVTDENGSFRLDQVPPGSYTLEFWHETLGKQSQPLKVTTGEDVQADGTFTAEP